MARRELILPWPPTVNTYWGTRIVKAKAGQSFISHYLTEAAKTFLKEVEQIVGVADLVKPDKSPDIEARQKLLGVSVGSPIRVHVMAFPPDKRARDLDNLCKGTLDAMTKIGAIRDDADIWDLRLTREMASQPPGRVVVRIWPFSVRTWEEAA